MRGSRVKSMVRVALAGLVLAGLGVQVPQSAVADNNKSLGMSVFRDILVDQAAGHVFVSGGSLVAADLDGNVIGPVSGISAARQMALSPDGSKLVVANGDFISVVDPVALTLLDSIPTGVGSCPESLAASSGKVFFTYGDCSGSPGLGALDLTTKVVTTNLSTGVVPWRAVLVSVPGAPSLIAAQFDGQQTYDPNSLVLLDTTGGATPTSTVRLTKTFASDITDLALASNGSEVLVAVPGTGSNIYSTTDFSLLGTYPDDGIPSALAIRDDGVVATGSVQRLDNRDLRFYAAGSAVAMRSVDFGYGPNTHEIAIQRHGLAFGASRAYAVTDLGQLRTFTAGPPAVVTLSTDKSTYSYGGTATITVTLGSPTTNRTVEVYSKVRGSARVLKASGPVDGAGKLTFKATNLTRNTTFSAYFYGDDDFAPATATAMVSVRAKVTISTGSTSMSGSFHKLRHSPPPTVHVAVYPATPTTTCVKFVVQSYSHGAWRGFGSIACPKRSATTGSYGVTMYDFPAGVKLRVQASYPTTSQNASFTSKWYYIVFV